MNAVSGPIQSVALSVATVMRRWKVRERVRNASLFVAVVSGVAVSLLVAFTAYMVLRWLLPISGDAIQPKDLVQFSLITAAGIGGVVALVVAYRRQRDIESVRFVERFGEAANQLGSSDAAVRLAGAYAMAGVGDEGDKHERQQCIDVLCGYLRLPYTPDNGSNNERELVHKVPARGGKESQEHHYLYRQDDKEVRQTIVRVIADHLKPAARVSWSPSDFDFTGAQIEGADFSDAVFDGSVIFSGSTFSDYVYFDRAVFSQTAMFNRAVFNDGIASFNDAAFNGSWTSFSGAAFRCAHTGFRSTTFGEGLTLFQGTAFEGNWVSFDFSKFASGGVFRDAKFSARVTSFQRVSFGNDDSTTTFNDTDFGSSTVYFGPKAQWDPAPVFDWDSRTQSNFSKPDNVIIVD